MSLLIKALHKAEQKKATEDKSTTSAGAMAFELAPKDEPTAESGGFSSAEPSRSAHIADTQPQQKAAGVIFAAKSSNTTSTKTLIITGIVLLIIVAAGFYYYLESLKQPELVIPPRPVEVIPTPEVVAPVLTEELLLESESMNPEEAVVADAMLPAEAMPPAPPAEEPPANEGFSLNTAAKKPSASSAAATFGEAPAKRADSEVKVTLNNPPPAINPNLATAYEAFNAGDDATAQASYRKVLQSDIRNTDALLGMAAIAMRQDRMNDAAGWYGQVLEVEPRNTFALAAMANLVAQADPVRSESRIKNLIAVQPAAAHLHAALGNLYAEQKQWQSAQQSFFEAHRLDAVNPEYAFNLAVSLDQLAKPALALQYYRQTLNLLEAGSASTIDRAALELRIAQLQ